MCGPSDNQESKKEPGLVEKKGRKEGKEEKERKRKEKKGKGKKGRKGKGKEEGRKEKRKLVTVKTEDFTQPYIHL